MFGIRRAVNLAVFFSLSVAYPLLVIIGIERYLEARGPYVLGRIDLAITAAILLAALGVIVETGIRLVRGRNSGHGKSWKERVGVWLILSLYAFLMALWVGSVVGAMALLLLNGALGASYIRMLWDSRVG